ncbi:MAG: Y-family DNA polymerase, partial [Anaerotardibacter sp.]
QQVSVNEAFLDITPTRVNKTHPILVARRIQKKVSDLGITCSIGMGTSKTVAKIASNQEKPRGLTVVFPGEEKAFLSPLPVGEMSGIGKVAQQKLKSFGIHTLGDIAKADYSLVKTLLGKNALTMQQRAQGLDASEFHVDEQYEPAKSVSNEISLAVSTNDLEEIKALAATMAHKVGRRLRKNNLQGNTLHLKLRYEDLTIHTCQRNLPGLSQNELEWLIHLNSMIEQTWDRSNYVRLVGVGVSGFDAEVYQEQLFDPFEDQRHSTNQTPLVAQATKGKELLSATDKIAQKFGENALRFGHELRTYQNNTGSSAKNPDDYRS